MLYDVQGGQHFDNLSNLPVEVLVEIFEKCSPVDMQNICLTCRSLNQASQESRRFRAKSPDHGQRLVQRFPRSVVVEVFRNANLGVTSLGYLTDLANSLHVLEINHCNGIHPGCLGVLGQLPNLAELILERCQGMKAVPAAVWGLTKLTKLGLRWGDLATLSEGISRLSLLQHLDLSGSDLTSLPEALSSLMHLQILSLDRYVGSLDLHSQ